MDFTRAEADDIALNLARSIWMAHKGQESQPVAKMCDSVLDELIERMSIAVGPQADRRRRVHLGRMIAVVVRIEQLLMHQDRSLASPVHDFRSAIDRRAMFTGEGGNRAGQ